MSTHFSNPQADHDSMNSGAVSNQSLDDQASLTSQRGTVASENPPTPTPFNASSASSGSASPPEDPKTSSGSDLNGHEEPREAQALRRAKPNVEVIIADIAAIGVPAASLGFAIASLSKHGNEGSEEYIDDWRNAASVLSTLFPIFFAAVVGRLVMQSARWKLEQGSSLLSLEQLLGSRTVGGALLSPIYLRCFNLMTAGLILFWAFSPLGAQCMLRIVEPRVSEREDSSVRDAQCFNTEGPSWDEDTSNSGTGHDAYNEITVLSRSFNSLLLAGESSKSDTVDLWGNPKIPLLSSLEGGSEENGWSTVPQEQNTVYASLVGIPLYSYEPMEHEDISMMVESTYLETTCDDDPKFHHFDVFGWDEVPSPPRQLKNLTSRALFEDYLEGPPPDVSNGTFQGYGYADDIWDDSGVNKMPLWVIGVDRFMDYLWANGSWAQPEEGEKDLVYKYTYERSLNMFENETDIEVQPTRLILQSMLTRHPVPDKSVFVEVYCNVTQRYVESEVRCERTGRSPHGSCRAVSQRPSQKKTPHENINYLNFPHIFNYVSSTLPNTTGASITRGHNKHMESTLDHLFTPTIPDHTNGEQSSLGAEDFNERLFSQRLTQVLNTYIQLRQLGNVLTGSMEPEQRYDTTKTPTKLIISVTKFHVSNPGPQSA